MQITEHHRAEAEGYQQGLHNLSLLLCVATLPHPGEVESRATLDPRLLGEAPLSSLGLCCHRESLWAGTDW